MSTPDVVRVVLVDDHAMVREALAAVLEESGGVHVVGQAADVPEAIAALEAPEFEVLVLDYNLPGGGAPRVLEEIARRGLDVRVLVLTVHENSQYAVRAFEAGAHGYVIKSSAVEELRGAIRAVAAGEMYVTPRVSGTVLDQLRRPKGERTGLDSLSAREFEVFRLLASGVGIKEAARTLSVSVSTASTHRARILDKLGLGSTNELIRFALDRGVVD